MTETIVKQLSVRDKDQVVEILYSAFESDPIMGYFFGDEYQKSAKHLMKYICDAVEVYDSFLLGAFINEELKGVASITPPENERDSQTETINYLD